MPKKQTNNNIQENYTAEDIRVLDGLEAVRRRPGMYIGSTDEHGLHHLVYEIVYNSIDEAMAGYCDKTEIIIHKDSSVTVIDNGRGIPVDKHPATNTSALEAVMTVYMPELNSAAALIQCPAACTALVLQW